MVCRRCAGAEQFRRVDSFERISLADDPADPNCGHFYIDMVYVMRCSTCGHRQESVEQRFPFSGLREAEKELDSHLTGKG